MPPAPDARAIRASRVLVVDDHEDCLATLAELVASQGCEVRVARNGMEAVEIAREFQPQVILLDLGLPLMDGYAAARKIKDDAETCRALVVAVTGHGTKADIERSSAAGVDLHLVKPVAFHQLVEVLHLKGTRSSGGDDSAWPPES
jgi:CheY-like chemotaxis protein